MGFNREQEEFIRLVNGGSGVSASQYAALVARMNSLEAQLSATQDTVKKQTENASVQNLLKNSDFERTNDAYQGSGGADLAFWFRGVDVAQPINATTVPKWEQTQGWIELSTVADADDVSYNFVQRTIKPGITYYLQFLAKLRDGVASSGFNFQAGLWSKTTNNWLSASLVSNTGGAPTVQKIGPAAAATTYGYKVVALFDGGAVVTSAEGTVVGAAALSATNLNRVSWLSVANSTGYRVYRTLGGATLGLIAEINSGGTSFDDVGVTLQAGVAPPASNPPTAKIVAGNWTGQLTSDWKTFRFVLSVPAGYNLGAEGAADQWLRFGMKGSGTAPAVLVDRVYLATTPGAWAQNPADLTAVADIVSNPYGNYGQTNYGNPYDYQYDQDGNRIY